MEPELMPKLRFDPERRVWVASMEHLLPGASGEGSTPEEAIEVCLALLGMQVFH